MIDLEKENEKLQYKLKLAIETLEELQLNHEHNESDKNYRPLGENYGYCHTCCTKVGLNEDIVRDTLLKIKI
jgi:hypothetical protein